jgi:tetratricopeptide (TPR) repeat protein
MATGATAQEDFGHALGLHRAGRLQEAATLYRTLGGTREPVAADARINLGVILDGAGRHQEALAEYREALALRPADPVALNNLGNTLMTLGRFNEAVQALSAALKGNPASTETALALGAALQRDGELAGACVVFRAVLERNPGCAEAHWNLALALLMEGEYREGWREYQWRWERDSFTSPRRHFAEPVWDGSDPAGRRILVHCEQGLGDTLQFLRYLPLLAQAGAQVLVEVQAASLVPLVERLPGVAGVHLMGAPLPPFDLQVPLLSLPYLFHTTLESIPSEPYLEAPPERLAAWRGRLPGPGPLRVGLAWAGKAQPDPFRSCTLAALAPLAAIPGVVLVSLQLGEAAEQAALEGAPELIDPTPGIADFADTAALVANLDLVVTVDTSVAHLAGALGTPTWVMLPRAADWRWGTSREDSPWYPGMRLFRQERQGEWGPVLARLAGALERAAGEHLEREARRNPLQGRSQYLWGSWLAAQGRHSEAALRLHKAALLDPADWQAHYGLAGVLQMMGRFKEAEESLLAALELRGELPLLHQALGISRQLAGDWDGAIASYRRTLELDPEAVRSRYNLAIVQRDLGRFPEALEGFSEVVARAPEHADAHWNLALVCLTLGHFARGWREFPWRFAKSGTAPKRRWQELPRWEGEPLAGRRILIYGEQGLGDTLQFIRYAQLLAERGAEVLVEVQSASLSGLIGRVAGVSRVLVAGETPPPCDLQASLLELPERCATDLATIPTRIPYLVQDPAALERAAALVPRRTGLRVGLVWGGNPCHENDGNRSLSPEKLGVLAGIPHVSFYSLQVGAAAQQAAPSPLLALNDLSGSIGDFSDTAALAAQLDLIITVDTSMAHLCGGLGLPAWVLIPFVPDWRWLLEREDSPWYPTLRLFRQEAPGAWQGTLLRVREALEELANARNSDAAGLQLDCGLPVSEPRPVEAAASESRLTTVAAPADPEVLNNLGCTLDNAGRHLEAAQVYRQAIALDASFRAPHYNLGNSLSSLGLAAEAAESYRRALALDPGLVQGWHNLALALKGLGALDDARAALERAVGLRPDYLEARHSLGELCHCLGDYAGAEACFTEVLAQDAGYLPSLNALGITCQAGDRLEEAVTWYRRALGLKPDYLHALNNLGAACRALGDLEQAACCYQAVIVRDPDYADAHWNLALVRLQLGDYRQGWQGYEWRFRKVDPIPLKDFPRPLWNGGDLRGRSILIHAEQGFGDTLQFVRYATLLARLGGRVLVQCQSPVIAGILESVPGVAQVLARGAALPEFDCHAPLMSLPLLCGTQLSSIPADIPYLSADPGLAASWRNRIAAPDQLAAVPGQGPAGAPPLRVGLIWAGRKSYQDDARRSLSLASFAPLARVPGVRLYALQVGEGSEQAACPPAGMLITDLGSGVRDFSDSAAIVAGLDLVISADTAVAHLAGGLGKPVWVLLPKACDWRWLVGRDDSPWYPTARLFRQTERGNWPEVLERVARTLALEAGARGAAPTDQSDQLPVPATPAAFTPDQVALLSAEGALAHSKGELERARALFARALELAPALPELHNNLGVTLQDLGESDAALACYQAALALRPDYSEAHCNRANTLASLKRFDEAVAGYRQALALNPGYHDAFFNLGNALRGTGRWPEAVESYRRLLELAPEHLPGLLNLGGSLLALNRCEEATRPLRRVLALDPECREAHWNLGHALLALGNYREGWPEYEWRLADAGTFPEECLGKPLWRGEPLEGRTLLLRAEQGFGDALQFFRFVPQLVAAGARLVVECRPELYPLFSAQGLKADFIAVGEPAPPFDLFAYLMSLPCILGLTLDQLPVQAPYLHADPALVRQWRQRIPAGGLNVGVVWSGSALYQDDPYRFRSLAPELLEPLTRIPGVRLCNLQPGAGPARESGAAQPAIHDLSADIRSFADTAAIIANLDLVITVDTALAHLAGALGAATLLLLPISCDWRWLSERDDSPWYPSLRLYRQSEPGAWDGVLERVARDLAGLPAPEPEGPGLDPDQLFRRANELQRSGDAAAAAALFRQLLTLRPAVPEVHNNLGLALHDAGELAQAEAHYRQALALNPELAESWNNLGTALVSRDDREGAIPCFREAIRLRGDHLLGYVNLGCALQHLEQPEEAVQLYRRALELKPDFLQALINLGTAYQDLLQPDQAIAAYREALRLEPECADAHWNLALSLLSLGDFENGWREYEWRFAGAAGSLVPGPRWDGSPLEGRTVLLCCEQGLGDTLQFVRYAPLVAERGGRVLVRCQAASLKPLLARVPGVLAVYGPTDELPDYHCHAPLVSLPHIFATRLDHLPAPVPYLTADPERVAAWRDRMAGPHRLKVGLVWRGGPLPRNRACPYAALAPLAALSGVDFFSLQLGEVPDNSLLPVLDLAPGIRDFDDSAAIIANLDLVLSIDTACAHLAGGMGVPVWTLLPHSCDWRWLPASDSSPWYPSMRLFRQPAAGDWHSVLSRVSCALAELAHR